MIRIQANKQQKVILTAIICLFVLFYAVLFFSSPRFTVHIVRFIEPFTEDTLFIAYTPTGVLSKSSDTIVFNWLLEDPNIINTYVQIRRADGKFYLTNDALAESYFYSRNMLRAGNYEWRVAADFSDGEQRASEWISFQVTAKGNPEILFGIPAHSEMSAKLVPLNYPSLAVYGPDGAVYISDTKNHIIWKVENGIASIFAGTMRSGYNGSGLPPLETMLNDPAGLTFTPEGNLIFTDMENKMVRIIDIKNNVVNDFPSPDTVGYEVYFQEDETILTGTIPRTWFIIGEQRWSEEDTGLWQVHLNGEWTKKEFPVRQASSFVFYNNLLYALCYNEHVIKEIKDTEILREWQVDPWAASFVIHNDAMYVGNHTYLRKINFDGTTEMISGGYANISGVSLGVGPNSLLLTDSDAKLVWELDLDTGERTLIAGQQNYYVRGKITDMVLFEDDLFLLDNLAACIWRYNIVTGRIEKFAGNGRMEPAIIGYAFLDSPFYYPAGLAVDSKGNLYVGEQHHILKLNRERGLVEIYAGADICYEWGYSGDGDFRTEARFQSIRGLCFDAEDNLYVADTYNHVIRKITPDGIVSTIAGNGIQGVPEYGSPANQSSLNHPQAVKISPQGDIYIADSWNNVICYIDKNGILYHAAGKMMSQNYQFSNFKDGEVLIAEFGAPSDIEFYNNGMIISDAMNGRIRFVKDGIVSTIVGGNEMGFSINDPFIISYPTSVLAHGDYLYVADCGNGLLRRYSLQQIGIN